MTDKAKIEPVRAWAIYNGEIILDIAFDKGQREYFVDKYGKRNVIVIPVLITPMETDNADE
jgi:hypothetical protein